MPITTETDENPVPAERASVGRWVRADPDELKRLRARIEKHGDHDQSSHGNWATGGVQVDTTGQARLPGVDGPPERVRSPHVPTHIRSADEARALARETGEAYAYRLTTWGIRMHPDSVDFVTDVVSKAQVEEASDEHREVVTASVKEFEETPTLQAAFETFGVPTVVPSYLLCQGDDPIFTSVVAQSVGGVTVVPESGYSFEGYAEKEEEPPVPGHSLHTDRGDTREDDVHSGWGSDQSLLRHEYAHYVEPFIMEEGRPADPESDIEVQRVPGGAMGLTWLGLFNAIPRSPTDWNNGGLGGYAGTDPSEAFGEAVSVVTSPHYGPEVRGHYNAPTQAMLDYAESAVVHLSIPKAVTDRYPWYEEERR